MICSDLTNVMLSSTKCTMGPIPRHIYIYLYYTIIILGYILVQPLDLVISYFIYFFKVVMNVTQAKYTHELHKTSSTAITTFNLNTGIRFLYFDPYSS